MAHIGPGPATRVTTKGRQNGTAVAKMPHSARFLAASAMHTSPAASRASQHKKAVYSPRACAAPAESISGYHCGTQA